MRRSIVAVTLEVPVRNTSAEAVTAQLSFEGQPMAGPTTFDLVSGDGATMSIDDEIGGAARVGFEVVGDGQVHLVVKDGGNGVIQDHADRAGTCLARAQPLAARQEQE